MHETLEYLRSIGETYLLPLALRFLIAAVLFFIGRALARALIRAFDRAIETSKLDVSLRKFLRDILYAVMLVSVVIASLDVVGIETTAVVAVLGAAGLAIGLALQGSLSNFAAGVMLIVLRPYKVGDYVILFEKYVGRVEAIKVFHTVLVTGDHREVVIPNGQIIVKPIENLTVLGRRRVDFLVHVIDAPDLARVKHLLETAITDKLVSPAPAPVIDVAEITETGIKFHLQPWTTVENYHDVATTTMERLREILTAAGLRFTATLQHHHGL